MRKARFAPLLIAVTILALPDWALSAPLTVARTEIVKGDVHVVRDAKYVVLGANEAIYALDTIVTGDSGRVKFSMGDGSSVFVAGGSQVAIEHYDVKYGYRISGRFNALRGKVRFVVQKVEGLDAEFSVQTKGALIEVTGTDFTVIDPGGSNPTQIMLRSGQIVASTKREKGHLMSPGQIARIVASGEMAVREMTPEDISFADVTMENIDSGFAGERGSPAAKAGLGEKMKPAPVSKGSAAKVDVPKVHAPKVDVPKVHAPKVDVPKVHAPKVHTPKVHTPKIKAPKI